MKKLLVLLAVCAGVTTATAQELPKKGSIVTEIGFTPFKSSGETFKLNDAMLKFRYFVTDKDVVRLKLGVGIDNNTTDNATFTHPQDLSGYNVRVEDNSTKTTNKKSDIQIMLGYERHFAPTGRFDVYAGAEIGFEWNNRSGSIEENGLTKGYSNSKLDYTVQGARNTDYTDMTPDGELSSHAFKGGVFAGLDFYIYKGLYIGTELGISFTSGKSPNGYSSYNYSSVTTNSSGVVTYALNESYSGDTGLTTTNTTINNHTTTTISAQQANTTERSATKLKLYVEPAIRLGWKF